MSKATRAVAEEIRTAKYGTEEALRTAATVINTLLDVIESSGTVSKPEVSRLATAGIEPLRKLREWHHAKWMNATENDVAEDHRSAIRTLNQYFPKDDQL